MGSEEVEVTETEKNAGQILAYLSKSQAAESFEGIANWWLSSDKGSHGRGQLEQALSLLISRGDIEETRSRRDIIFYQIRKKSPAEQAGD
jgi:hypothetical protein